MVPALIYMSYMKCLADSNIEKSDATRGKGSRYTWEALTPHVASGLATRVVGKSDVLRALFPHFEK